MNGSIISRNHDHNLAAIFPRTKPAVSSCAKALRRAGAQIAINLANASEFRAQLATVLRPGFRVIIINVRERRN